MIYSFSAEREEGRLRTEILRLEKELDSIKERKNVYEVSINIL